MARVHYKGSSTFCCSSENPCEEHLQKFPADPAQSAPSAEPKVLAEKFLYERLGFAFKAINSCLNVTVFKPFKVMSLSQSDRKWDVVYLMDKAWDLLVELAAEKQAAALRTAQLERERQQVLDILWKDIDCERDEKLPLIHVAAKASNAIYWRNQDIAVLRTRAETAESALRDARDKTIQECIAVVESRSTHLKNGVHVEQETGNLSPVPRIRYIEDDLIAERLRALLTVAAQTPEEKS